MRVTSQVLDEIRNAVESIDYGEVRIKVNEKGEYIEISTEKRTRISKDGDTSVYEGLVKVYRTDA
jgi:hypothetical protein